MESVLKYRSMTRKPNPMVNINSLKRGTGKVVSLADRLEFLKKSRAWQKTVKAWKENNNKIDPLRLRKFKKVKLKYLLIDEDIQRMLSDTHCAKIADLRKFDSALLDTPFCIIKSTGEIVLIDSQHTTTIIAALIDSGFFSGEDNWGEYEITISYIETDQLSFARKAFGVINGKGKKPQSAFQQLRNNVFVVRIDNDLSDKEAVEIEQKVAIAESHECFPVEENTSLTQYPGTFTNISTFLTLNNREIEQACAWHNKYFHCDPIHVSEFFIFREICRSFETAKIPVTSKLTEELAGLIQNVFGNLSQYKKCISEAYRKWSVGRYGYEVSWMDDAYTCTLIQLYKRFGGKEKVAPVLLDRFDGIVDFFDQEILDMA